MFQASIELLELMGVVKENGHPSDSPETSPLLPTVHTPLSYDYVLVAKTVDDPEKDTFKMQEAFIEKLKMKNLKITKIVDDTVVFYGIQAPKEVFEKYMYLLKVSDVCNWSETARNCPSFHQRKNQKELRKSWARWTACLQGQPISDVRCKVWLLSDTCLYAKVSILFDNEGTVMFAMFMAVWATLFLEFWKRHRASYTCAWKVFDWCEEEEELILEIVNDAECEPKQHKHSYLRSTLVLILATLVMLLIIGLAHALVVFRVVATVMLAEGSWEFLSDHSNTAAVILGAVLHYFTITIMTWENQSFAATERSFTVKMFTFQINGHPGGYVRIAGKWRLEECHPSGCLTDLFIQMAIIMVLKQTISNIFEFGGPWFNRWLKRKRTKLQRKCAHCYKKEDQQTNQGQDLCENCMLRDWLRNYRLKDVDSFSLFNEFLEMVLQFSFTTIFVAAFPLAPLLAFINNVVEIRLDAIKMVSLERRMVPKKTNNIGVWTDVLEAIGVLAVIANGLILSPAWYTATIMDPACMSGYINNTLSILHMNDQRIYKEFSPDQMVTPGGQNVSYCSYKDYRSNEDYSFTPQFWLILAMRFAFVILFEHVVVICKFITAWFVPSVPFIHSDVTDYQRYGGHAERERERGSAYRLGFIGFVFVVLCQMMSECWTYDF
ncbi:unnamed protein product [Coregonus sp. 'balchen']|nr:unnamed protein product [Coregonus sp. 'balchen']